MYPTIEDQIHNEKTSDDVLVRRILDGDSTAFEALVSRYRRLLISVARRITGSLDDAEDMSQQTFMKALTNLPSFRFRSSFSTWLVSIVRNEARTWARRNRQSRELPLQSMPLEDGARAAFDWADARPNPETLYLRYETHQLLRSELRRLRPKVRSVIEICDLQEQSTADGALALGLAVSTLKSRRKRGRAVLRRYLERHLSPSCAVRS